MPDALDVFGVDEMIASLSYDVYRGQVHVITDPAERRTQAGIQKGGSAEIVKWLRNKSPYSFCYTGVPAREKGKPLRIDKIISFMDIGLFQK